MLRTSVGYPPGGGVSPAHPRTVSESRLDMTNRQGLAVGCGTSAWSRHCPWMGLLGDHGAMDVLSSRVPLHPTDPERSRVFYRDVLGLAIYREFGSGPERGTAF